MTTRDDKLNQATIIIKAAFDSGNEEYIKRVTEIRNRIISRQVNELLGAV